LPADPPYFSLISGPQESPFSRIDDFISSAYKEIARVTGMHEKPPPRIGFGNGRFTNRRAFHRIKGKDHEDSYGKGEFAMPRKNCPEWIYAAVILMAAVMAMPIFAQSPTSAPKLPKGNYSLTIDGTATLVGNWACVGNANVRAIPDRSLETVPGLGTGVRKVTVTTSVSAIDCGDSTMNKHLRNALRDTKYPEIRYKALKYTLVDNGAAVQTSGELTIAGTTKPVKLGAKLIALPDGGTRVVGKVKINMRDYGVEPPTLFFGTLKVAGVVTVKFDSVVKLSQEVTQDLSPK